MFYFQNFPFLCTSYSNNWLKQVKRKLSEHAHKGISMVSDIKYFPDLPIAMESSPRLQNLDLSPTSDKKCTGGRYDVSGWLLLWSTYEHHCHQYHRHSFAHSCPSLKLIKCFLFSDAVKWKFIFGGNVEKAAAKSWHCQNIVDLLTPFLTCSTQCQLIIFFRAPVNLHFSSIYIFWLVKCDGINHHIRWHVIIAMLDIINIHQTSPISLWVVKLSAPT